MTRIGKYAGRKAQIIADFKSGKSVVEITKEYGISKNYIYEMLKDAGVQVRNVKVERNALIAKAYRNGSSVNEIAKVFGITGAYVRKLLDKEPIAVYPVKHAAVEIPRSASWKARNERNAQIIEVSRKGKHPAEIANVFGLSESHVRRILVAAGYTPARVIANVKSERNARIIDDYKRGKTYAAIARDLHISRERVCQIIKRQNDKDLHACHERGYELERSQRNTPIVDAFKQGRKVIDIAREFGISDTTVYKAVGGAAQIVNSLRGETENTKYCHGCGIVKPLSEFYRNRGQRKGRYPRCKMCVSVYQKALRDRKKTVKKTVKKIEKYHGETEDTKRCKQCGEIKPLSAFYKDNTQRKGRCHSCKLCQSAYHRARYYARKAEAQP